MSSTLPLRHLWTTYRRVTLTQGFGIKERDASLVLLENAFGARGVLKVLAHLHERGDYEELHRTIERQGRLLKAIQQRRPRPTRH